MGKLDDANKKVDELLGEGFPAPTRNKVSDVPLGDPRATLASIKKALTEISDQVDALTQVIEESYDKKED